MEMQTSGRRSAASHPGPATGFSGFTSSDEKIELVKVLFEYIIHITCSISKKERRKSTF